VDFTAKPSTEVKIVIDRAVKVVVGK
jgi:hypothetical protein